jgi:hypothetical protein
MPAISEKAKEHKKKYDLNYAKKNLKRIPLDVPKDYFEYIKEVAQKNDMPLNRFIKDAIIEKISRQDDEIINMGAKIIEMWFTAHSEEMPEGAMEDCISYFRQYMR